MDVNSNDKKKWISRACFVPGCKSGYSSNKVKCTLFRTPKDETMLKKWDKAIARFDKVLGTLNVVCELHFSDQFIVRNFSHVIHGEEVLIPRAKPVLAPGAFPTIFPKRPKYRTKTLSKKQINKYREILDGYGIKNYEMPGCVALGCKNKPTTCSKGVTFHKFPNHPERRDQWIAAIGRNDWQPVSASVICSKHFRAEDFDHNLPSCVRVKENAVPSIFPACKYDVHFEDNQGEKMQMVGESKLKDKMLEAIKYDGITLDVLDQLLLPHKTRYENILNVDEGWELIRSMKVTGSAAISVVGALSLAVELKPSNISSKHVLYNHIKQRLEYLITAQPTAVKLKQMANSTISRSLSLLQDKEVSVCEMKNGVIEEIEQLVKKDISINKSIGLNGGEHILSNTEDLVTILTHSSTGSLVTAGYGTAFGVIRWLHQQEKLSHVYFTKTLPYNQGTRLTAYELLHDQIPATMICDSMVSALLSTKKITAVVVGAEKIAANGDIVNDIGTYNIAITAQFHGVPFYVATSSSTQDMSLENGSLLSVERPYSERSMIDSQSVITHGIKYWNPIFDITPAELITGGIITEHGVFPASFLKKLRGLWTHPDLLS